MSIKPFEYPRRQFVVEVKGLNFKVILREETLKNIREAIEGYLEAFPKR
jgi:predicted RNase H-like HicB family nuclease